MSTHGRFERGDWGLALLLFVGTVAYLSYLPRNLGIADESHFLYEAKRIRDGEVMYRDFFQFVTPGASYAMAFLYWAFGTTITTARIGTAVLHGLTAVLMYAACRTLHVRRALAATAPLAYLALCQSAWQFASWHWFATFFMMLVLFALLRGPWPSRPRWSIVPGLATGLLIAVQQQKGVPIAVGVGGIFLVDYLIDRRYPDPASWRRLATRLSYFFAGVALIVIPLLATFLMLAGFQPLFDALVGFPLGSYRKAFVARADWGYVFSITKGLAEYTFPTVLKYLPIALLPACIRAAVDLLRRADRVRLRALVVLIVLGASAALSIGYFPDFIHVAFIASVFLVAAAEALEWALTTLIPARLTAVCGWVLAVGLIVPLALHMRRNAVLLSQQFPYSHETAFGRIDFADPWEPVIVDTARTLLSQTPTHELFAYPNTSRPYLTTGGKNPTPFQYLFAAVSPPQHTDLALAIIKTRAIPYVVVSQMYARPTDAILQEILEHYELVTLPAVAGATKLPTLLLYRRKEQPIADTAAAPH